MKWNDPSVASPAKGQRVAIRAKDGTVQKAFHMVFLTGERDWLEPEPGMWPDTFSVEKNGPIEGWLPWEEYKGGGNGLE